MTMRSGRSDRCDVEGSEVRGAEHSTNRAAQHDAGNDAESNAGGVDEVRSDPAPGSVPERL